MRLRKPKRSDFEKGHHGKADFAQALQVYYLIDKALEFGAPLVDMLAVLEAHDGGFIHWRFMVTE